MSHFSDYRFPFADLTLKPGKVSGQRALCLVYADTRAYQDALDDAGVIWQTTMQPISTTAVVVALTIDGVTRSATGEDSDLMSAEARAFKRACSAFGLGRYLYNIDLGWQPFDGKQFAQAAYSALSAALNKIPASGNPQGATPTPWQAWHEPQEAYAWAVNGGYATSDQHARNALKKVVELDFGGSLKQSNWPAVAEAFYHNRLQRREEKEAVLR